MKVIRNRSMKTRYCLLPMCPNNIVAVHSRFLVVLCIYIFSHSTLRGASHASRPSGALRVPKLVFSIIFVHILSRDIESAYVTYWTPLNCARGCVLHCLIVGMTSTIHMLLYYPYSSGLPCRHWGNLMIAWWRECGSELSRHHTSRPRGRGVGCPWLFWVCR